MGELFDRYVVVDWSASARPVTGANSIWIAVLDESVGQVWLTNPSTRRLAERQLVDLVGGSLRTLVAIDASLGYPTGTAEHFGWSDDVPWRAIWSHVATAITDDDANVNNRFAVAGHLNRRSSGDGPFWGRPVRRPVPGLEPTKPVSFPVPEYRRVEELLRERGRRPSSVWQLMGAGSVGSQTLTLLPVLHRLHTARAVEVWPFSTGVGVPGAVRPVVVETWPTAFDLDLSSGSVRDAAQVDGVARRLLDADRAGELATWFEVAECDASVVEAEEGWVLAPGVRRAPAG